MATLEPAATQPLTARLAGAGSMREELEALFAVAPREAMADDFRRLLLDENAANKRSGTARMWAWKRLKLRYALDSTDTTEFQAFRRAFESAASRSERGLIVALMLARTDRLFREVTLAVVSPLIASEPHRIDPASVAVHVDNRRRASGLIWSSESLRSITNHVVSSWRETGFIAPGRGIVTVRVTAGPVVAAFGVAIGKAEGLTDRAILRSQWFRLLGADENRSVELVREAAAAGLLTFRLQADVAEIRLADASGNAA